MLNELDKKILKITLESKEPVSSKELALRCDAAINTIRKEIGIINEEVRKYGFCISSKTSVGHYLEIHNPRVANAYIQELQNYFRRNQKMNNRYSSQVYYLTRKCLMSSSNLTVESLCQELFCSRGTILRDLSKVKEVLKSYGLTLKNKRGGYGLVVEGDEWNIRQCLLYQHKIRKLSIEQVEHKEYAFKSLFFMRDGAKDFDKTRMILMSCLAEQMDFFLPVMNFPKIIHYTQLSQTRQKQISSMQFSKEQTERAKKSVEYQFARKFYGRLEDKDRNAVSETDVLALAMLFLSYETENYHLKSMDEYHEYYDETLDLIEYLSVSWGYRKEIFDENFIQDWISFLYTLRNRRIFNVYMDKELVGSVKYRGIRSADFCIFFSRFYERRHGIQLSRPDTLSSFYIFNRLLKQDSYCYYALSILVISQYGIQCAKSLAVNIRKAYGKEVKIVVAAEICAYIGEGVAAEEDYDLLITDLEPARMQYLTQYGLPILSAEFSPMHKRCPELDDYIRKVQYRCEQTIIKDRYFYKTELTSKEEVFIYLAAIFEEYGINESDFICHLKENDSYIDLERENGVVLLPVFLKEMCQNQVVVLINKKTFIWNENSSQIFVCYNRISSLKENQMLNGVLERFVNISAETASALIHGDDTPIALLYPDEDNVRNF